MNSKLIYRISVWCLGGVLFIGCHSDIYINDLDSDSSAPSASDTDAPNTWDSDVNTDCILISLTSEVTSVQPMTGIVFWSNHENVDSPAIQLEFSYVQIDEIAVTENPAAWNWDSIENLLDNIASRQHQAVLRFYYAYPGRDTTVPTFIKETTGYNETIADVEGSSTSFPDWSSEQLKQFSLEFYSQFAERYDRDPRIVFLQVGFGLWGGYHIYDPGVLLGENFPDMAFQEQFATHLAEKFVQLRWSVSIDAADESRSALPVLQNLNSLSFGLFDDSFMHESHGEYNHDCFELFGINRRLSSPVGGEFSHYSEYDQIHMLDLPDGPYGTSYESAAEQYNISYMIGNDQLRYQSEERLIQAGIASGYHFEVIDFCASSDASKVTVSNTGVAPIYYDAYISVNGVRADTSLKFLLPGEQEEFSVAAGGHAPILTIECDRLVPGQTIQFDASLNASQ